MQPVHATLFEPSFAAVGTPPALESGDIHLWLWRPSGALAPRQLARRARVELVGLLKAYADSDREPQLAHGAHGKPYVATPGFPHFNVSHGGDCVALAFCRAQELGVDVERGSPRRRYSALELATRFFSAEEAAALARLDDAQRERAFLQLWTCKEAILKALGHGLSFGLHRLCFAIGSDGQIESLRSIAQAAGSAAEWQIHRFEAGSGHLGSLAWHGPARSIRTFRLDAPSSPE